jgi:ABC-type uncharacterized transport system substrate-binding protein
MIARINRRETITVLGGAAAWPLAADAQQRDRVRRIGWLNGSDENDPAAKLRLSAFTQALADLGWTDGRNVRIDRRWAGGDINRIRALAQELVGLQPDISGLVVMLDGFTLVHRAPIISAAARNNVPAVYSQSDLARDGGLLSYEVDRVDTFRRAATYVDRILRGAKPSELPIQLPTKFAMILNLKTVKALGLAVPPSILLRADEQIE